MTARLPVLVVIVCAAVAGLATDGAAAATLYGGGVVAATTDDSVPLVLVSVDRGRATVTAISGGPCSNGSPNGFGRFKSRPARLRKGGRFRVNGSFAFNIPGATARGTYRISATVRAGAGVAGGRISLRLVVPRSSGAPLVCKGLNRAFRARNPATGPTRRTRGPFYGVTSQALPIMIRPSADSTALAPVAMWTTLSCTGLGPVGTIPRIRVPLTAPGLYAKSGNLTGRFTPEVGSGVVVPLGTYTYSPYSFQAQVLNGQAAGSMTLSTQVGNAQKQLIDTCAAPPITFVALP